MQKNKYLLVSPDYPPPLVGGSLVYVHGLVENCPEPMDILTTTLNNGHQEITNPRHRVIRSRFLVQSNDPPRLRLLLMYVYMLGWVFVKNLGARYDAVIVNPGVIGNSLLILLLKLMRVPVIGVGYAEELTTSLKGRGFKSLVKRKLLSFAYQWANGFLVVSHFAKNILQSLKVDPESVIVIPPSLHSSKQTHNRTKSSSGHHILSVGRLIRRKGFNYLIGAVARLKRDFPEIRLTIVGGGDEKKNLLRQIAAEGLQNNVEILSGLSDEKLNRYYTECDLFVLANLMLENGDCEGSPTVFIEANAYGMPVIGGIEGGTATVIEDGRNGFLVNPRDIETLAQKIMVLLQDKELRKKMGAAGLEKITQENDPKKAGLEFSQFIQAAASC